MRPKPVRIDLGGCNVTLLSGGRLRLDGGAMFGIIPKALWSRTTPADDDNCIQLACNCLLVEWQSDTARRVIIETGHGAKYSEKERRIFGIDPADWLLPTLLAGGIDPLSISDVVLTHLHFDHAGGLTHEAGGRVQPTFPRARVHVQRREFDDARANFGVMTNTYREENFAPLDAAGAWSLLDGPGVAIPAPRPGEPEIHALHTPGHTRGHQSLLVAGRDRRLLFVGDVMPTRAHVGAPYNMGYDLFPIDNRASKRRLLQRAVEEGWLLVIDHEPETPLVQAVSDGAGYRLEPLNP
ncbi:MAG: MBL fold metallo-hydrolase [Phycisphaerae bacterium]|nr:MBL fold metallo-hydrolase [Phycisphaerae bacterium]MCZ2399390.1 MBL fold metallo-hydrolase [Phycisphaerae bacterium]NUQ50629.1 MBL fold metallo-hydrolase [Phycisphaerae bacterium]